ncbi:hypothetical protein BC828DRAFT_399966 [Blastocladiella britannica]|nr:hypothetical protein BC828DRAFT_399966 [Blastocladiella britannica]
MCISCLQHVPVHDLGRHLSNCVKPPTRPTPIAGSARLTGSSASPATPRRDSAAAIATATPVQRHQPERVQSSPVIKKAPSKRIDDVDNDEDAVPLEQSRPPDVHAAYSSSYDNEVDPGEQEDIGDRLPCPICKRKFAVASLERHEVACAKLNSKRRPVFNTQAKRVLGTELEKFVPIKGSGGGGGAAAKGGFDDSIPAISKPTGAKSGMGKEAPKARTGPRGPQMDMVSCPSCSRSFSADAAERHIPPCKERKIKEAFARKSNAAADDDMLQKRTKYQPPSLKRH